MTDDSRYGRGPMMNAVEALKAFNALPEHERREAIRDFVQRQIDLEIILRQVEHEPYDGPISPGVVCRAKPKRG